MEQGQWRNVCCNPFNKPGHNSMKKNLRSVLPWMIEAIQSVKVGDKICDKCRKELTPLNVKQNPPSMSIHKEPLDESCDDLCDYLDDDYISQDMEPINMCLKAIGETPIVKKKLMHASYTKEKLTRIRDAAAKTILPSMTLGSVDDGHEIIEQLKEKFRTCTDRSQKVQILTILPKSWTVKKIQEEFSVTNYMARKAKDLAKVNGVLSSPNPKHGCTLPTVTITLVQDFYELDEISRMMPGKKDFVSIREGDHRVHVQKRLILGNLKEIYQQFKEKYPTVKVGFSKFAELRPRNCVLAGTSGTHAVCVCALHQNIKLMMVGGKIAELSAHDDVPLKEYSHCLAKIICNPPHPNCYFQLCSLCPGTSDLQEHLYELMDNNMVDSVEYKQWVSTDRSTLETLSKSVEEFVELFCDQLKALLTHSFIAKQQSMFQAEVRSNLADGVLQVIADFSENYSFILQDEIQGFHWNNAQATIHPFVIYHREADEIHQLSFVIISDCLQHDTVAVYLFQKCLIEFLTSILGSLPQKILYFSDGSAAQYKNRKNFINLCYHKTDFRVDAEWHFFATSHGKGPCDGLGGTVKRLAARASLQRAYDHQIMTPRQLYEWACDNIPKVHFQFCTCDDYKNAETFLQERFHRSKTIAGTQKLHCFVPLTKNTLFTKVYSNSSLQKEEKVASVETEGLPIEEINGFVTVAYEEDWWIGCVLNVDEDSGNIKIELLCPRGPSQSFKYPLERNTVVVPYVDILTKVDPRTVTGHTYTISKQSKIATNK